LFLTRADWRLGSTSFLKKPDWLLGPGFVLEKVGCGAGCSGFARYGPGSAWATRFRPACRGVRGTRPVGPVARHPTGSHSRGLASPPGWPEPACARRLHSPRHPRLFMPANSWAISLVTGIAFCNADNRGQEGHHKQGRNKQGPPSRKTIEINKSASGSPSFPCQSCPGAGPVPGDFEQAAARVARRGRKRPRCPKPKSVRGTVLGKFAADRACQPVQGYPRRGRSDGARHRPSTRATSQEARTPWMPRPQFHRINIR